MASSPCQLSAETMPVLFAVTFPMLASESQPRSPRHSTPAVANPAAALVTSPIRTSCILPSSPIQMTPAASTIGLTDAMPSRSMLCTTLSSVSCRWVISSKVRSSPRPPGAVKTPRRLPFVSVTLEPPPIRICPGRSSMVRLSFTGSMGPVGSRATMMPPAPATPMAVSISPAVGTERASPSVSPWAYATSPTGAPPGVYAVR